MQCSRAARVVGWVLCGAAAVLLPGCGSGDQIPAGNVASPAPAPVAAASDVAAALTAAGLKLTSIVVVTEATDDNQLMGRPGQYTSKVFFYDARHPKSPDAPGAGENTIETFATAEDAKARRDYIEQMTKGSPLLLQYQILHGRTLVRLDKALLPSEVEGYREALAKLNLE
jgi:hypothetical protein